MNETELENIMFRFINGEYDILVCTTIIESGLDMPNEFMFRFPPQNFMQPCLSQEYHIKVSAKMIH